MKRSAIPQKLSHPKFQKADDERKDLFMHRSEDSFINSACGSWRKMRSDHTYRLIVSTIKKSMLDEDAIPSAICV
jgi:hypothetical protein